MDDDELVTMTAEEFNAMRVVSMHAHGAAALESFAVMVRQQAGILFATGKDTEARIVRDIAKTVVDLAKEKRRLQEECQQKESNR